MPIGHVILQVLEKLRPLDQKLRYQVDKLIRMSKTGLAGLTSFIPQLSSFHFSVVVHLLLHKLIFLLSPSCSRE